jgi:protein SCO1
VLILMTRLLNNIWIVLMIIMIGCKTTPEPMALPFINKPDFTPEWISKTDAGYHNIHTIPAFSFTNQNGETVTDKTVADKIYVADFFFTKCGSICPKMTADMRILQDKYKDDKDVLLLSHSVTPEPDSVQVLKRYAENKGIISGKWHLLTGDKNEIYALAKKQYYAGDTVGFYQTGNEFLHTENFILIDKQRRIRGVYNGTLPLEMERIIDDITTLKKED